MRGLIRIIWEAIDGFLENDGWAIASHIALATLTSMFPFLLFLTALASLFGSKQLADQAASLLFQTWPQRVAAPLSTEIHNVLTQPRTGVLTLGVVLALYFSSSGIEALRIGLNRAYRVKERRTWWLLRLESILYVFIGALALLAVTFLVVLGPLLSRAAFTFIPGFLDLHWIVAVFSYVITMFLLMAALIIAHKWLPAEQHALREIAPGVLLTFTLSLGFAVAFSFYISKFATNYVNTYAGLASVMIALLFLYTLAVIFLFGGELNAALCRRRSRTDSNRRQT